METTKKTRKLKGVVVSDKMEKTIVVLVSTIKKHVKYQKQYKSSKKYQVHDQKNKFKVGDKVEFVAIRPISKLKCWKVVSKKTN